MKKYSRLTALLLALFLLLGCAACAGGEIEETTETASTTAPETTEAVTEVTTEEVISVVAPPETTEAPETEPPKAQNTIRIIMQDGVGEAVISALADEFAPLLDERERALLYEHSAEIELSKAENLEKTIENTVLSGTGRYDLILTAPLAGIDLLNAGLLENLGGAGISITPDRVGINESITESLSVGGGVYLFSSVSLVSDISSTYAIRYSGEKLSSDPVEKALAGEFTAELMLTYIAELQDTAAFSLGEASPLTLYRGLGGNVFIGDEKGVPTSAISESSLFKTAYDEALKLYDAAAKDDAVFGICKLSPLGEGGIYLPIPKAHRDIEYSSPIDHTAISVFAAPAGVVSGSKLCALVDALNSCSHDYRENVRKWVYAGGSEKAEQTFELIESNAKLDLGILFGWGDICEHIENGLQNNKSADDLLADRMTEMRNKAAATAASILADKLGIER